MFGGENAFLGENIFLNYMLETKFSGQKNWGGTKSLGGTTPECPLAMGLLGNNRRVQSKASRTVLQLACCQCSVH